LGVFLWEQGQGVASCFGSNAFNPRPLSYVFIIWSEFVSTQKRKKKDLFAEKEKFAFRRGVQKKRPLNLQLKGAKPACKLKNM